MHTHTHTHSHTHTHTHTHTLTHNDLRQQGVRSMKVANSSRNGSSDGASDSHAAYMIMENEVQFIQAAHDVSLGYRD